METVLVGFADIVVIVVTLASGDSGTQKESYTGGIPQRWHIG